MEGYCLSDVIQVKNKGLRARRMEVWVCIHTSHIYVSKYLYRMTPYQVSYVLLSHYEGFEEYNILFTSKSIGKTKQSGF